MKDKFSNQIDSLMTSLTGDKIFLNDQNDIYNRKNSIFTFMYIDISTTHKYFVQCIWKYI